MILYYLKSTLRSLKQNGKFTAINIIGFAFGISICLAIVTFLLHEFSYDRYHENANKIVRLTDTPNNSSSIDYRVKNILLDNFSEFEDACLVQIVQRKINLVVDDKGFLVDGVASVDNNFFNVFTVDFISGGMDVPLPNINSAILTKSAAKTLFGTENALGKEFIFRNDAVLKVSGVIEDFPDNSSINADILVNAEEYKFSWSCQNSDDLSSYRYPFRIYMQLNENVNELQLLSKVNDEIELLQPYSAGIGFLPLKDIYLKDSTTGSRNKKGNLNLLRLMSLIAIIILLLAVVNYVNLTVAQQNKRSKNIGIRKTVGAFRNNLLFYFLTESILVTVISFVFAVLLLKLLIPFYNSVFEATINLRELLRFPIFSVILLFVLIVGIISGIGPALVFSRINPVKVFSGVMKRGKEKGYLRNSLTIFQFTISIALILGVITIQRQIFYVKHKDSGFNQNQLVRLKIPRLGEKENKAYTFINELRKSPFIKQVAVSSGAPGEIGTWMGTNIENSDKNISAASLVVDTSFVETFGLQLVKGRLPQPGDFGKVCLVNEAFFKHFEFDNLENKKFNNYSREGFEIIGVVKDFQFSSLHDKIEPICILFANCYPSSVNVKLSANGIASGMNYINTKWNEILSDQVLEYQFYDEWFDSMYKKEERFAKTISLFAILAIVISCIGILGLATFIAERRIKEIGIRKVNGAKVSEILSMLNRDFIKWVAIAFVIATPVAWYTMNKWLENFAYKTNLSWWIFALAGALALGIALLTVSWQSWRAATRNPVEALRYE